MLTEQHKERALYPRKPHAPQSSRAARLELMLLKQIRLMGPLLQCNPLAATLQRRFLTQSSVSSSSQKENDRVIEKVLKKKRKRYCREMWRERSTN